MTQNTISKQEELSQLYKKFGISTNTNSTSHFLIPTVLLDSTSGKALPLSFLKKHGFINAYFDDFGIEPQDFKWYKTGECFLYLLFAPKDYTFNFLEVEGTFKSIKAWVDYYDLDEEGKLVVHVFKVGEKFKQDYRNFVNSEFSKISNNLKELYVNKLTAGIVDRTDFAKKTMGDQYGIDFLNEYKNEEILSKIDFSKEALRY